MKELIFISTEDLIEELESRSTLFVAAYISKDETGEKIQSRWSEAESWLSLTGLVNILKSNIEAESQKDDN